MIHSSSTSRAWSHRVGYDPRNIVQLGSRGLRHAAREASSSLLEAGAIGALYQLGATWSLGDAAAAYLDVSQLESACALGLGALLVGLGWAACWLRSAPSKPVGRAALAVASWWIVTVCPVGLGALMVGHPLTAAGWWLPGSGWVGLVLVGGAFIACVWRAGLIAIVGLSLISICPWLVAPPSVPALDAATVHTSSAPAKGLRDLAGQYDVAMSAKRAARAAKGSVIVPRGCGWRLDRDDA